MLASKISFTVLFFVWTVLGQYQCYYGFNKTMDVEYIPCGPHNVTGASTCCYLGDICLAQGACFSPSTGMTYVAGCTDPLFRDPSCAANVCDKTAQVEGLALCDNNWICCSGEGQQGDKPAKAAPDSCPCDKNYGTIASGSAALMQTAFLPSSFGGAIRVIQTSGSAGLVLSSEPIPTSGDNSLPPTATPYVTSMTTTPTSSLPTASSTSTSASTSSQSSGNNLTLPLAISLTIGPTLLLAAALLLVRHYRRRRANRAAATVPSHGQYFDPSQPSTTIHSPSLSTSHMWHSSMSPKQGHQEWPSPPPPPPQQTAPSELSAPDQPWPLPSPRYHQASELDSPTVGPRKG